LEPEDVVEHLLAGALWRRSRSSGPGGQRRDKVETRAELTVAPESLEGLPEEVASRLRQGLGLGGGEPLRLVSQESRFLARNQEALASRLLELVSQALAPPPPPRRKTRPSRAKVEQRLVGKTRRGAIKALRQPPRPQDD
jgi:ribosome-associated protein